MANNQSYPQSVYPIAGDVQSTVGNQTVTVTGLQGVPISTTAPTSGQVLELVSGVWTPTTPSGGPSFSGSGAFMFGPGLRSVTDVFSANWGAPNANSVNSVLTANLVTVFLFQLDVSMTVSEASTQCTNNVIGPTASFGIYSFAGNKLVDAGSFVTLASHGVQTNPITPATLVPGMYWHAQACTTNTSAATFSGILVSSNSSGEAIPLYVANATRTGTAANPMSAGVLPATLGTITSFTPSSADGDGCCAPIYE